jgi:hypothetical protein
MAGAVTEYRLKLLAAGFDPVPARGKETFLPGWNRPHTAEEIQKWEPEHSDWANSGIRTAPTPALDNDILIPEAADAVEDIIRNRYSEDGTILVRVGLFPKRAFLFKTDTPFPKMRVDYRAPNGSKHHIEFLGDGQQVIVDGVHPDTKKPYAWRGRYRPGEIPREDLPETDEAEARDLVATITAMLARDFGFTQEEGETGAANGYGRTSDTSAKSPVDVEQELADVHFGKIHDTWGRCMGSLLRAGVPANDIFRRLLTATADSPACQADPKRALWSQGLAKMLTGYLHDDTVFVVSLPPKQQSDWHQRRAEGRTPRLVWRADHGLQVRRERDQAVASAGDEPKQEERAHTHAHGEHKHEKPKGKIGWPTPYTGRAAAQIPLRSFILGQHYLIGATSVTASAGGIGKSTLSLLDAVSFCVGRNLLTGELLDRCRRVWVWNAEDDIDEMERRVVGICSNYNVNRADLHGWLFLDSGYDLPLDLAQGNGKGTIIQEGLIDLIAARVKELGIEVVMLDPLVALHTMSESDNPGHAKLIRTLSTRLGKPAGCAVDINAHTRKPGTGQESMTVDDIRGPRAIVYSARSGRILHPMSLAEAERYGIEADDRLSYYRLERAKANMAKRGTICWVRMIEVPIANRPDGSYGDIIAVPIIWTPPAHRQRHRRRDRQGRIQA